MAHLSVPLRLLPPMSSEEVETDTARLLSGASAAPLVAWACSRVAGAPLWAWLQLACATLAVSTAGAAFLFARDVPPALLAGWRLLIVTLLLLPAACVQWRRAQADLRQRWRDSLGTVGGSGVALAFHFGLFATATQTTALSHALLFACATPLVLAAAALAQRVPLSRGELAGTACALVGGAVLVSDAQSDTAVTLSGDACALGAAVAFAVHLTLGRDCRTWCPLFLYVVPANATASASLLLYAMLHEGVSPLGSGKRGLLGFLNNSRWAGVVLYLACVPGVLGHTSFSSCLKHISPLVITVAITFEPLLGSVIGYLLGQCAPPHARTYLGGLILMGATVVVVWAEARRKAEEGTGEGEIERPEKAQDEEVSELPSMGNATATATDVSRPDA